jgi:small-conductance mechanosensitive channel
VALLGAAGLALGLAVQGILGDIAAAIIMAIMPTFTIGDVVSIHITGNVRQGRVEDFTLTNTSLVDIDTGSRLTVPNRMLLDTTIVNHTSHPHHYAVIDVPVLHVKKNLVQVIEFISKFLRQNPGGLVRTDVHPVTVGVMTVTETASVVRAKCVVDSIDFLGAELSLRTAVAGALTSSGLLA